MHRCFNQPNLDLETGSTIIVLDFYKVMISLRYFRYFICSRGNIRSLNWEPKSPVINSICTTSHATRVIFRRRCCRSDISCFQSGHLSPCVESTLTFDPRAWTTCALSDCWELSRSCCFRTRSRCSSRVSTTGPNQTPVWLFYTAAAPQYQCSHMNEAPLGSEQQPALFNHVTLLWRTV